MFRGLIDPTHYFSNILPAMEPPIVDSHTIDYPAGNQYLESITSSYLQFDGCRNLLRIKSPYQAKVRNSVKALFISWADTALIHSK